jgi:beta-glucosidase
MKRTKNPAKEAEYRKRAADLVAQMTLHEKVSQMLSWAPAIERLGIPAYNWWSEGIHGVGRAGTATVFPQAIGMAAAFDEDMMEQVGNAVGVEARGKYNMCRAHGDRDIFKGLTVWAPNINIFRDPRWGRGHETYGEDPFLTSRLGVRFVEGMQGDDPDYLQAAACAKHFAVHSGPESDRHHFNAIVSKQDLWETYLPAFRALVKEAGVEAVMGAYNRTNGEPCCGSKTLLKDILRDKWHFDGHVTSDCWAIKDFHTGHMVTDGPVESVALAVNNGCDLNCGDLYVYLEQAVAEGKLSEEKIDESLTRLYVTRMRLGMFDAEDQVPYNKVGYDVVDSAEMKALNLKVADSIMTLLKNDGTLPLDKSKLHTVGVIGPNADSRKALLGNYEGTASRYTTVLEGIEDYLGDDVKVRYSQGCHLYADNIQGLAESNELMSEVKGVCEESDVVIAVLGLDAGLEGEEGDQGNQFASGDKPNLKLPGHQEEVLKACVESGKPVVLVLLGGSALAVNYADEHANAILEAWYPGARGGEAVARALFGETNPQGKLPVTFYYSDRDLPEFTDYAMKGRTYRYMEKEALYPFGYGLSYTKFGFKNAAVSANEADSNGLDVTVDVTNEGSVAGRESVEVYVKAERENTPNAQLKGLAKVELQPGETKQVKIHLPLAAFALCNEEGTPIVEAGSYSVYVGASQPDARSVALMGQAPAKLTVTQSATQALDL